MKKVYLIVADTGSGHRNTARALQKAVKQLKLSWEIHIINFYQEIIGTSYPDKIYNFIVKKGWTKIQAPILVPLFKLQIRLLHSIWVKYLEKFWVRHQPDLVVSLVPFINRELYQSLQKDFSEIPFATVLSDFIDYPPHFWIEQQKQFLICPTKQAVEQAISLGHQEEYIFCTSGLVINPQFYQPITNNRRVERQGLNLDPDLPTGLVMFGGRGSTKMLEIANNLEQSSLNLQLIFICGRNEKLANTLRNTPSRLPRFVETFTHEISYYMHLADFFIGKPGPGAISEAVKMNLPVITEINASTLMQERCCADWIQKKQVGIVIDDFRNIACTVEGLIKPKNLFYYRSNTVKINNQGVFDVVKILTEILS